MNIRYPIYEGVYRILTVGHGVSRNVDSFKSGRTFSISDKACSGICPAAVRLLSGHYL